MNQLENLRLRRPINILHGPIMRIDELIPGSGADAMLNEDAVTVLMEFLRLRNLKLGDLFPGCDQPTDDCHISQEDFKQGLMVSASVMSVTGEYGFIETASRSIEVCRHDDFQQLPWR